MPRPVKDDPRYSNQTVRLSRAEKAELRRRAAAAGMTPTAYARQAILKGFVDPASDARSWPAPPRDPAIYDLMQEGRRIGVNVNQIAHRVNEYRPDALEGLAEALAEIRAFVRQAQAQL